MLCHRNPRPRPYPVRLRSFDSAQDRSGQAPQFRPVVSPSTHSANSGQASLRACPEQGEGVHPPQAGKLCRTTCAEHSRTVPGQFSPLCVASQGGAMQSALRSPTEEGGAGRQRQRRLALRSDVPPAPTPTRVEANSRARSKRLLHNRREFTRGASARPRFHASRFALRSE